MIGPAAREAPPQLSLVAPAKDEEGNLRPLYERVCSVLPPDLHWELVLVDDGSRDATARRIGELVAADARVVGVVLARNQGQSAATMAGVDLARGAWIATLDADLQNDPADLVPMLAARGEHDAVVGYRRRRADSWLRRVSSRIANAVRNAVSGDSIRDTGCALKLMRAEALRSLPRFDGMHRFLPTLLRIQGHSVIETPVSHHPRLSGHSKYGIRNRAWRALLDLLAVRWLARRTIRTAVERVLVQDVVSASVAGWRPHRSAQASSPASDTEATAMRRANGA